MALLVPFALPTRLHPFMFPMLKKPDGHQWMRTGNLLSISRSSFAVMSKMSLHLPKGTITTKNMDSLCSIRASMENPCMFFTNHSVVGCCSQVIIGYWIGPDPEDDWGFVEAFLNKI